MKKLYILMFLFVFASRAYAQDCVRTGFFLQLQASGDSCIAEVKENKVGFVDCKELLGILLPVGRSLACRIK